MATKTKPTTREIGNSTGRTPFRGALPYQSVDGDQLEDVPALQWPECTKTYPAMLDGDAQVQALSLGITVPAQSQYRAVLHPGTLPAKYAEALADDLDVALTGQDRPPEGRRSGRVEFGEHLAVVLRAPFVGHKVFELVAEIDKNGMARLRKLAERPEHTITRWPADANGEWTGVEQGYVGAKPRVIPRDKLVVYSWRGSEGNPMGKPLLRAIYSHAYLKDICLRTDAMQHGRHGVGIFKGTLTAEAASGAREDLLEIGEGIGAGEDTTVVLPEGTDGEMIGMTGTVTDPIASAKYHDEQMARALLGMILQAGQTETGSRALGQVQMDILDAFVLLVVKWAARTLTQQVVERWILWNLGEEGLDHGAYVAMEPIEDVPSMIETIATLVGAGLITVDATLEAWLRKQLGLPEGDPLPDDLDAVGITPDMLDDPDGEFAADITPTSTMVALYPPADVAQRLAVQGGETAADLHVTLAYLGETLDDKLPALERAVREVAEGANLDGLSGTIAGSGTFTGGDRPVQIALVDLPNLPKFRENLVDALRYADTPASTTHGYTPHMTLRYGDEVVPPVAPMPVRFDHIRIVRGNQEVARIPLTPRRGDDHDHCHPSAFAAGSRRALSDRERRAHVDPDALDALQDQTAGDLADLLAELRRELTPIALELLRVELTAGGTDQLALRDGALAQRLGRELQRRVPQNRVQQLAQRLARAVVDGAATAEQEAAAQGAQVQPVDADQSAAGALMATALVERVVADVATAVAGSAQRLAPLDEQAAAVQADTIVADVATQIPDAPPRALQDQAAGAASQATGEGRIAVMRRNEQLIDELFAMELLDPRTCRPCELVDGKVYDTVDDALIDYPTGKYKLCEGWDNCRGRVVALYLTQTDAAGRDYIRDRIGRFGRTFVPFPSIGDASRVLDPTVTGLSPEHRAHIVEWQKTDRAYELVQGAARRTLDPSALSVDEQGIVRQVMASLDTAIVERPLPRDIRVFRGVRSMEATLGVPDLEHIVGVERILSGFNATTVDRGVAVREFTGPRGALLELDLSEGTPALWVAGAGSPDLARQGELLLQRDLRIRVTGIRQEGDRPVVLVQVIS